MSAGVVFARARRVVAPALVALIGASAASGAIIAPGLYELHNHPDGAAIPPPYGMRLDELYNTSPDHDIFTFNFDDPGSNMQMMVTATTIHIFGVSVGGWDIGGGYDAGPTFGLYTIDFLYTVGVMPSPGDDDVQVVAPSGTNFGTILTPLGDLIALVDQQGQDPGLNFRLGDENDDLGHRGHPGISGWGWLTHGPPGSSHVPNSDWIFTATLIPSPGAASVLALGALAAGRRRRR